MTYQLDGPLRSIANTIPMIQGSKETKKPKASCKVLAKEAWRCEWQEIKENIKEKVWEKENQRISKRSPLTSSIELWEKKNHLRESLERLKTTNNPIEVKEVNFVAGGEDP